MKLLLDKKDNFGPFLLFFPIILRRYDKFFMNFRENLSFWPPYCSGISGSYSIRCPCCMLLVSLLLLTFRLIPAVLHCPAALDIAAAVIPYGISVPAVMASLLLIYCCCKCPCFCWCPFCVGAPVDAFILAVACVPVVAGGHAVIHAVA
jgi:hypothetical protein